jgi:hypothetical protein
VAALETKRLPATVTTMSYGGEEARAMMLQKEREGMEMSYGTVISPRLQWRLRRGRRRREAAAKRQSFGPRWRENGGMSRLGLSLSIPWMRWERESRSSWWR